MTRGGSSGEERAGLMLTLKALPTPGLYINPPRKHTVLIPRQSQLLIPFLPYLLYIYPFMCYLWTGNP